MAEASSSFAKNDLESRLVASLFDIESGRKVAGGDSREFEVEDYELTEAILIDQ
jgi:hypothetical protein